MGLLAASLACPEQLRPWAAAGLELLFLPEGLPQDLPGVAPEPVAPTAGHLHTPLPSPESAETFAWPAPWSTLAARLTAPPRVIITYASLALDLSGAADPARRKLFQRVLAYLSWPTGTTLFWPITFAPGAEVPGLFATDVFAQGVRSFAIGHVLCFGQDVAQRVQTLYPEELKEGPKIHPLPTPEVLAPLLPHELHRALATLKDLDL